VRKGVFITKRFNFNDTHTKYKNVPVVYMARYVDSGRVKSIEFTFRPILSSSKSVLGIRIRRLRLKGMYPWVSYKKKYGEKIYLFLRLSTLKSLKRGVVSGIGFGSVFGSISQRCGSASGSASKCHRSPTLFKVKVLLSFKI